MKNAVFQGKAYSLEAEQGDLMTYIDLDTTIETLGPARIPSPALAGAASGSSPRYFVSDEESILVNAHGVDRIHGDPNDGILPAFEAAGPRRNIYFDPSKLRCALVTCGGLCPGLNDIIRAVTMELHHCYGVRNIYGIRYGLQGFIPKYGHDVMTLTPDTVRGILNMGGTILGSSRGPQDMNEIVDSLERMNIGVLFIIGGDGTLMAASKIADVVAERGLKIGVIGIPKTIDNDICMVSKSFGFDTAVEVARHAIQGAHNEAEAYHNGIGMIKLMGRYSGFIAATAALAQQDVNYVLIPEIEFDLDGPNGLLASLEKRLMKRGHAVIVVAEGAGQKFFNNSGNETDPSGNIKLQDIGLLLKDRILEYLRSRGITTSLKYIDPSYTIRSLPANANDAVFCNFLGRDAVHAAVAGKTRMMVSHWNNHFVHVPMKASAGRRNQLSADGKLWHAVLESTGQGELRNPS